MASPAAAVDTAERNQIEDEVEIDRGVCSVAKYPLLELIVGTVRH